MTLSRRVAAIEANLSPSQLVLRWLAEAHTFGDIESFVGSLVAQDPPVAPLDRLAREAVHGARARLRGKRPDVVDAAVRSALRETVFRFELVMRINVAAHDLLDRESLIDAALSAHVSLAFAGDREETRVDPKRLAHLVRLRDLLIGRVTELLANTEARRLAEERYLDGHGALFPAVAAAWEEQVRSTGLIADMAVRMAELDAAQPAPAPDPDALSRRTTELVADLVEPAKSEALDKLGEGRRALDIAKPWVRAKLAATNPADAEHG